MLLLMMLAALSVLLQDNYKNIVIKCVLYVVVSGIGGGVGDVAR